MYNTYVLYKCIQLLYTSPEHFCSQTMHFIKEATQHTHVVLQMQEAEIQFLKEQNELEISKAKELSEIEVSCTS